MQGIQELGEGTRVALVDGMKTLDSSQLEGVTGGEGFWNKVGNGLVKTGQGLSEGWSAFKAYSSIDDSHPPNQATFAELNAKREMHGKQPYPTPQQR